MKNIVCFGQINERRVNMNFFRYFEGVLANNYSIIADELNGNTNVVRGVNGGNAKEGNISTPEAQLQEVRNIYEGTQQWLMAPNGKKSKLNERQWLQVRTPNFKRWFGDWENDPSNASKILDQNGEPLVVYHGTNVPLDKIKVFECGDVGWLGPGIYLTPFTEYASQFSDAGTGGLIPLFLNIRNPLVLTTTWRIGQPYLELLQIMYGENADRIYHERYEAVADRDRDILATMPKWKQGQYIHRRIITGEEIERLLISHDGINWDDGEYSVIDKNKVKSAIGNNGEFGLETNEIYAQRMYRR